MDDHFLQHRADKFLSVMKVHAVKPLRYRGRELAHSLEQVVPFRCLLLFFLQGDELRLELLHSIADGVDAFFKVFLLNESALIGVDQTSSFASHLSQPVFRVFDLGGEKR